MRLGEVKFVIETLLKMSAPVLQN